MSDRTLVGMGLKLEDVGGDRRIGGLDLNRILADLRGARVPTRQLTWLTMQSLESFDRIFLARGEDTGLYEAALTVRCHTWRDTPFVTIEALSNGAGPRDAALLRRLLAFLLLRLDTFLERPVAILGHTRNPSLARAMQHVAGELTAVGFYPDPGDDVVSWTTASLAHRLARGAGHSVRGFADAGRALRGVAPDAGPLLVAIDLREVDEARLIEEARQMFRQRLSRLARVPLSRGTAAQGWTPRQITKDAPLATPFVPVSIR